MKWRRRLLLALGTVFLLVGLFLFGTHLYLRSSAAARKVEAFLAETLGSPARVDKVSIGLFGSSTGEGIQLFEAGQETPWVSIRELTADRSILDILKGEFEGSTVGVKGARLRLRFDAANRLLTELPRSGKEGTSAPLPAITIADGELSLEQEGREPFVLAGIEAGLTQEGDRWQVKGVLKEPQWGMWKAEGELNPASGEMSLILRGERIAVAQKRLRSLPFIPLSVWQQIELDGPANIVLQLRRNDKGAFGYRVEIEPLESETKITSIGLDATQTTGNVVVENGLVTFREVKGYTAGGTIEAEGELDFRPPVAKLAIRTSALGVDLKTFTRTWEMPDQIRSISGRLTGKADLSLTLGEKLFISGEGRGRIDDAKILGDVKTEGPINLRLFYVEGKPRFSSEMSFTVPRIIPSLTLLSPLNVLSKTARTRQDKTIREVVQYPVRAVSWLQDGIRAVSTTLAVKGKTVMGWLPGGVANPEQPPTYFEASFTLKDVNLGELIKKLGVEIPFPVSGRGNIWVKVALPVDQPNKVELYRLDGSIQLDPFKIADLELAKVEAKVRLLRGVLQLESLKGQVSDGDKSGAFEGSARMEVAPLGEVSASLTLRDIPLQRVLSVAPTLAAMTEGRIGATLTWKAPARQLTGLTAWSIRGKIHGNKLHAGDLAVEEAVAMVRMEKGELAFTDMTFGIEGVRVTGTAQLATRDVYPFSVDLKLAEANLTDIKRLFPALNIPPTVTGMLGADAVVKGTLMPMRVEASGSIASSGLKVGLVNLASAEASWKLDESGLTLEKIDARVYDGFVSGSARIPLRAVDEGTVDLTVRDLDARLLGNDLKLRLEGKASGTMSGRLEPKSAMGEREVRSRLEVEAPKLRIQGMPVERLKGRLGYRRETFRYHFEGDAAGGRFEVDGKVPANPQKDQGPEGSIRVRRALLGSLLRALAGQNTPPPLRGLVDLTVDYNTDATGKLNGDGKIQVTRLRWDRVELASRLSGPLRLRGPILEAPEFAGEGLGGAARFRVLLHLTEPDRSWITATLERLETSRIASLFVENGAVIEGPLDARLQLALGREWRGGGEVVLTRGKVGGVDVAEWRLPLRVLYYPNWGSGQIDIDDTGAQLAMGRASGRAAFAWGQASGMRLEGHVRFRSVEMRSLLRPFADVEKQLGDGRASGQFEFSGRDMRSLQDLAGRLELDFTQAQALEMPILRVLTPYLRGVSSATSFEKGDLRATLGQGLWRIRRLTVESSLFRLMAEGTVTTTGRLDLEVTARTGELIVNSTLLRFIGLSIGQPLPVEVLIRASEWLSNRVVHLRVDGTLKSPSVRFQPVSLLSEDTVRFFIQRETFPASGSR